MTGVSFDAAWLSDPNERRVQRKHQTAKKQGSRNRKGGKQDHNLPRPMEPPDNQPKDRHDCKEFSLHKLGGGKSWANQLFLRNISA